MVFGVREVCSAPIPHQFFWSAPFLACQRSILFKLFDSIRQGCVSDMNIPIHGSFYARMTEQLLQDFRHNSAFNRTSCTGVSQSVHTKTFDMSFIAQLVQMSVIGTVLCRLSSTEIDEHQISHTEVLGFADTAIHIFQNLRQQFWFLAGVTFFVARFEYIVCPVRQRNSAVAAFRLWRTGTPYFGIMPVFQCLADGQCPLFPVVGIPSHSWLLPETSFPLQYMPAWWQNPHRLLPSDLERFYNAWAWHRTYAYFRWPAVCSFDTVPCNSFWYWEPEQQSYLRTAHRQASCGLPEACENAFPCVNHPLQYILRRTYHLFSGRYPCHILCLLSFCPYNELLSLEWETWVHHDTLL